MAKLTSAVAFDLVTRIEALKDKIHAIYREANDYDGLNNSNIIRDIVAAREEANDQKDAAEGMILAFDAEDED